MSSRLSRPVFDGAPTDNLAVVDVYDNVTDQVKNTFQSTYSDFAKSLTETIGSQRSDLASLFADVRGGNVGLKTGLERTRDLLRGARGEIQNLSSSFQQRINNITNQAPISTYQMVKANVDGVYKTIRSADLNSVTGITNMLNDLSGNAILNRFDIGANVALLTAVLEEIDKWEVPEFVDEVMKYFKKDSEDAVFLATANSANQLSLNGDIDTIEAILRHTDPSSLTRDVPDFAYRLLARYTFKNGETVADYPRRLEQLIRILDLLQPNWLYVTRGERQVYSYAVLQGASPDAKTLLSTSDVHRIAVLTAPNYPVRSALSIMESMYPLVHFRS